MEDDKFLKFVTNPDFFIDSEMIDVIKQGIYDRENAAKLLVKQEEIRIKSLYCPCCKSTEKSHFIDREHNGIYGSGSSSWVRQEYIICLSCGIHYNDLNKKS